MRYKTVIFDLDGTLMNTQKGVYNSFKYALAKHGRTFFDNSADEPLVLGPPLHYAFTQFFGMDEQEADQAVKDYRECYAGGEVENCEPYEGIPALLEALRFSGMYLAVATSKAEPFALRALKAKGLFPYFDWISAPDLKSKENEKCSLIRRVLERAPKPALMVGDRVYDIEGAKQAGVHSAYAVYGYGNEQEGKACAPTYLLPDVAALEKLLLAPGKLITFEGGDGAGKTTQILLAKEYLEQRGYTVCLTREPGGTPAAERIRQIVLDPTVTDMHAETEMLLYAAARAEHVRQVLFPALARGEIVLCDRYLDSSIAYQGYGRGLGVERVMQANAPAIDGLLPDRTYLFTVDTRTAAERATHRSAPDRLEKEDDGFKTRVEQGFLTQAAQNEDRICVIDANGDVQSVFARLREDLGKLL